MLLDLILTVRWCLLILKQCPMRREMSLESSEWSVAAVEMPANTQEMTMETTVKMMTTWMAKLILTVSIFVSVTVNVNIEKIFIIQTGHVYGGPPS
jgi:hypothetical protein